jgi:hypothetical protein
MQNRLISLALFWFGIAMAAVFLCCGFVFLFTDVLGETIPRSSRTMLGVIFLLYGSFRATRQYFQYKKWKRDEKQ